MKTKEEIIREKELFAHYRQQYFKQLPPINTDNETTIEILRKITETKIVDNVLEWILNDEQHIFFLTGYMTNNKQFDGFPSHE